MRFFHAADIHLGAEPDKGFPWSKDRGREIWDSFRRLIQQVGKEKADLFLIAGDLFHRQPLMRELKEVNYLFSTIPDTKVVLIAGNHDYLKKDSCYRKFPWADNVYGLWDDREPCVEFPDIRTAVYGFSYDRREITDPLYHHIRAEGRQPVEILLAHGGDETHIPFRKELLEQSGFDYIALGHIHKPGVLSRNQIAYSGALEPVDKNDTGSHGYIKGTADKGGISIRFVPLASRSYVNLDIKISRHSTQFSLEEMVKQEIEEKGPDNIYNIVLTGQRDMDIKFDAARIETLGNIRDIKDETRPACDMEVLKQKFRGSLIESYIREFEKPCLSEIEEKAFAYGLEALLSSRGE